MPHLPDPRELRQRVFFDCDAQAGRVVAQIDHAIDGLWLAIENVPEKFVADFDVDHGEEFRHRGIQAGHQHVEIVHLAGMGDDRDGEGFGERLHLAGLGDAADAIGVELDVVHRFGFQQVAEAVAGELVLAAGDGNAAEGLECDIAADVVGDHRFFEPAKVEGFEQRQHAARVVEVPAHVRVGHEVDARADGFAHGAHQLHIFHHAGRAIDRAPAEAELHRFIALALVHFGFGAQVVERLAVEAAGVHGDLPLGAAAEQLEDGLFGGLAHEVPEGDIDRADGRHADALAAERHGLAVHVLPEEFGIEGVFAHDDGLQVEVDDLLGDARRERGVADADEAGVGEDLDDQPAVKAEGAHRVGGQIQQVHRVGAEMRLRRHRLAAPLDYSRAHFGNLHVVSRGRIRPTTSRIIANAITWNVLNIPKTAPYPIL